MVWTRLMGLFSKEWKLNLVEFDSGFLDPLYNKETYTAVAGEIKGITKSSI